MWQADLEVVEATKNFADKTDTLQLNFKKFVRIHAGSISAYVKGKELLCKVFRLNKFELILPN